MERKHTFDQVAEAYEKYRPAYPSELFRDVQEYALLQPGDPILEIGCGTGQATQGFVQMGCDTITCVELGERLAAFTREKFKAHPGVEVIQAAFEQWEGAGRQFKLAISGTAFHFIQPQELGYRKVHKLLEENGVIAFFWTVHVPSYEPVFNEIREWYRRFAPNLEDSRKPAVEQVIEQRVEWTERHGLFRDIRAKSYRRVDPLSADAFVALLATNSGHRLLPEADREQLFNGIKETIERHGGTVSRPQAVVLVLARKA
ncbi:class I SAM-dependent DNA methyltransferase [Paenibacillus koleovorans]|uniref:class I SAM-dependent DNA methyltransferase n=1 Tax=Paenibacillus koleovorans TaxID=121608 RepID=UPI000FDC39CB|nr:class I SAM-dependent methyltransferase [Paenibacillus koleovorans]